VVYWQKFDPTEFEFEFDETELSAHKITADEAVEVFWNGFDVRRNKRYTKGYQLIGLTDGGRKLKLIVYERGKRLIFIKTGWDV
jgi:uncharacterized DUF497 family protein